MKSAIHQLFDDYLTPYTPAPISYESISQPTNLSPFIDFVGAIAAYGTKISLLKAKFKKQ